MSKKSNPLASFPVGLMAGVAAGMVIGVAIDDIPTGIIIGSAVGGILPIMFSSAEEPTTEPPEQDHRD